MDTTKRLFERRLELFKQMKQIVQKQIKLLSAQVQIEEIEQFNLLSEERQKLQDDIDGIEHHLNRLTSDVELRLKDINTELMIETTNCIQEIIKQHQQLTSLLTEAFDTIGDNLDHLGKFKNAIGSYESQGDQIAYYFDEKK